VRDGALLIIVNSPASALAAVVRGGDVLAGDADVEIARGRGATVVTWGCGTTGACKLVAIC
jgi:hypothetical protein